MVRNTDTRPRTGTHPCPVECGRRASNGHLMCYRCWMSLPQSHKGRVWRTWLSWKAHLSDPDLMHAYDAAAEAATTYVKNLRT